MNRWMTFAGGLVAVALLSSSLAYGQQPRSGKDCPTGPVPQKVEGQVVSVDRNTSKVTIRDQQGMTHQFQSNPETVQDLKPGDRIEAQLRQAPKC